MSFFSAIFLGLVQGIAEFLPISSSGHLAFFQTFFQLEEADLFFDVLLHLGTLIAVFFAYREEIKDLILSFFSFFRKQTPQEARKTRPGRRMILLLIVATLPLVAVLPVKDYIESLYYNTFVVGFALIATGLILFFSDRFGHGRKAEREATLLDALVVGIGQAIAVMPGISRSGTSISAGLVRGFDRQFAIRFSFLMSIPAVLGANILSLIDAIQDGINWSLMPMYLAGVVAAMVSGYLAIRLLRYITSKSSFGGFAYYCWGAGLVTILLSLFS